MQYTSKTYLAARVKQARAAVTTRLSTAVATSQRETTSDREAKGPSWVSRVTFSPPQEHDVLQVIADAIETLGTGDEKYVCPTLEPVHAQWTGFRAGVSKQEPEPKVTEEEKYHYVMKEVENPITVLYAYGGLHHFNGPATRRATATELAKLTKGRCLIVQHRLAPQNPFPAAPLDVLLAYLSLLYPPPASAHAAVSPKSLVLAGDSSGAQLVLSLIQIILATRTRRGTSRPTLRFHGRTVELALPAGVAIQSPGLDHQGVCLPSWNANGAHDIFPDVVPSYQPGFPADHLWPSVPPRGSLYCETSMLCHPLVSPVAAKDWDGAPPLYIAVGSTERVSDCAKVTAQRAAKQGVVVLWDEYELMPHNWPMVLSDFPQAEMCYVAWAEACARFAGGEVTSNAGAFIEFDGLKKRVVDVEWLTALRDEEVERLMKVARLKVKPWTGDLAGRSML